MTFLEDLESEYLEIASPGYNLKFSSLREALASAYEELDAKYLNSFIESGEDDYDPISLVFLPEDIAYHLRGVWQLDDSAVQLELGVGYGND